MQERINKLLQIAVIKWIVLPVALLMLGISLTVLYMVIYDNSFLILSYNHPKENYNELKYDRLTKGEKIKGSFVAKENNLGIVAIRFQQFLRIPYKDEDTLIFRIKEKGEKSWYYENTYKSGLTFDVPFLPFGFPIISDSKDKTYIFEVESLYGNEKNGVIVSARAPNLISKYSVTKELIISDRKELLSFLIKKLYTSATTIDILFSSIINLLPLALYFVYLSPYRDRMLKAMKIVLPMFNANGIFMTFASLLLLALILIDILILQINNDILYIVSMVIWILSILSLKNNVSYSYVFGILFIALTALLYTFDNVGGSLKANSWAFSFLVTAFIQSLFISNIKSKKKQKK